MAQFIINNNDGSWRCGAATGDAAGSGRGMLVATTSGIVTTVSTTGLVEAVGRLVAARELLLTPANISSGG